MSLPEYTKNGYGMESLIELHHFIIQQVRIPTTEKQTIRKIMQLALNIGQFIGKVTPKYKKKLGYAKTNLDQLDTYVKKSDINKLNELISNEFVKKIQKLCQFFQSNVDRGDFIVRARQEEHLYFFNK